MHVENFDRPRLFETAALFGPEFEDRTRFVYHGTSSVYASQIEVHGWTHPFHAVDPAELRALADTLPTDAAETAETLHNHAASPTRLSFAAYSFAAVLFATTGGGQIVGLCRKAITQGAQPSKTLKELLDRCDGVSGVVYAVDFSEDDLTDLTFEGMFFHCVGNVDPTRIKAKVEIPSTLMGQELSAINNRPDLYRARLEPGGLAQRIYYRDQARGAK